MAKMRAARMYRYKQPLTLEEIPIPDIETHRGAGQGRWCRQVPHRLSADRRVLPQQPTDGVPGDSGHEIAGAIARIGSAVPAAAGLSEGGQVVGFGPHGGHQEYVPPEEGDSGEQDAVTDVNDHIDALGRGDFVGLSKNADALTIRLSRNDRNHE